MKSSYPSVTIYQIASLYHIDDCWEWPPKSMAELKRYGIVLAEYLSCFEERGNGWWYRLPQLGYERPKVLRRGLDPHDVFPHFGTLFGLSEDATCVILIEMGC